MDKSNITPLAAPGADDIRRWQALPRDEQLKRLRQILVEAESSSLSDRSINDIRSAAKKRLATMDVRRHLLDE